MRKKKESLFDQEKAKEKYTILFNKILESVYEADLTRNEYKVFLFILRKTFGWQRDSAILRVRDIAKAVKIEKNRVSIALSSLKKQQIVDTMSTNRYQIQMDTSLYRFKTRYVGQRKRGKKQNVDTMSTNRKKNVDTMSTSEPEDSSNNQHLESPKEKVFKRKKRTRISSTRILTKGKMKKPISSLSREEKSQNLADQELKAFGINYLNKVCISEGWESFTWEGKEKAVCNAIPKLKAPTKIALVLFMSKLRKSIDKRAEKRVISNKGGLFRVMIKEEPDL